MKTNIRSYYFWISMILSFIAFVASMKNEDYYLQIFILSLIIIIGVDQLFESNENVGVKKNARKR